MKQTSQKVAKFGAMLYIIAIYFIMNGCKKEAPLLDEHTTKTTTTVSTLATTNVDVMTSPRTPDFKNFYGVSWRGTPHDNLLYAKQMKYDYVFYQNGMEKDTLSNDLYFYIESPEYLIYNRSVDKTKSYTADQKAFYQNYCVLKNTNTTFPENLATGWFFNANNFTAILDFQQQKVITYTIDSILNIAKKIESRNPKFHFGGLAWDVPQPSGDFWTGVHSPGKQITLAYWTGSDTGVKGSGTTQNFTTYSEGHIQFYKQLFKKTRLNYPGAKFIMEPYSIYNDWIKPTQGHGDYSEFMPDLLCEESNSLSFFTNPLIYATGMVSNQNVSSTTPNIFGTAANRLCAATAALQGATFGWFGRFGGSGDMPDYKSITEVPARLKLIRVLSIWENLNNTPLSARTWNGETYKSASAFAGPDGISILQPGTNKLFVVFMSSKGEVPIPSNKKVTAVFNTDNYLRENGNGAKAVTITTNNTIKPTSSNSFGGGYIIYLSN